MIKQIGSLEVVIFGDKVSILEKGESITIDQEQYKELHKLIQEETDWYDMEGYEEAKAAVEKEMDEEDKANG